MLVDLPKSGVLFWKKELGAGKPKTSASLSLGVSRTKPAGRPVWSSSTAPSTSAGVGPRRHSHRRRVLPVPDRQVRSPLDHSNPPIAPSVHMFRLLVGRSVDRSIDLPVSPSHYCFCMHMPRDPAGGHGGDAPAEPVGNSSVTLWQPAQPPSAPEPAADELRRRAEKARIRERILREEAEHWELELEVRNELKEQMLRLSWPVLGRSATGSDLPPAPAPRTILGANSSLPAVALEVCCPLAFSVLSLFSFLSRSRLTFFTSHHLIFFVFCCH